LGTSTHPQGKTLGKGAEHSFIVSNPPYATSQVPEGLGLGYLSLGFFFLQVETEKVGNPKASSNCVVTSTLDIQGDEQDA